MAKDTKLRKHLADFGRRLAACQWHGGGFYSNEAEDRVNQAVEEVKAEIGRTLLACLEEAEEEP